MSDTRQGLGAANGRALLILIAGLPGTGKTTFAQHLSVKMKIPMISKDIIKEHLFDTIGFKNRKEKVALGAAAADIMYHIADLHLKVSQPVILENNFEDASKPPLLKLVESRGCRTITVKFHTDKDVLDERFLLRDKSPERHRGHVINTRYPEVEGWSAGARIPDPAQYWDTMRGRGMDTFSIGGEEILVDTTDFSKVSYEAICGKIETLICPETGEGWQ